MLRDNSTSYNILHLRNIRTYMKKKINALLFAILVMLLSNVYQAKLRYQVEDNLQDMTQERNELLYNFNVCKLLLKR